MECRIYLLLKLLMSAYRLVKEAVLVDLPQMHTDLSKRLLTRATVLLFTGPTRPCRSHYP
jgi:hypothetical protein